MADHPAVVAYPLSGVMVTDRLPDREPTNYNVICTIHNRISIAVTPLEVLTAVLDTSVQHVWNTFNRSVDIYYSPDATPWDPDFPELSEILSQPGMLTPRCRFSESVELNGGAKNNLEVVSIEEFEGRDGAKSYRLVWKLVDWSPWLMSSRRTHDFVERDGKTEYECWTELGGLLAWATRWTSGAKTIEKGFDGALASLKKYLEIRGKVDGDVAEN